MPDFEPIISLSEFINHCTLLEDHPWLTSKRLAAWERKDKIRCFRPNQSTRLYVEKDILRVIEEEMSCGEKKAPSNTEGNGSAESLAGIAGIGAGTMTEAERLAAEASERRLLMPRKKG